MPARAPNRIPFVATVIVGIPVGILLAWPQAFAAQMAPVVAQVIAFRSALSLALALLAIVATVIALVRRRWAIAAGIAIVLGAASLASAATLLTRGSADALPPGELTVLSWNTEGGAATPETIARLVLDTDADIVSLPETNARAAAEVVRIVADGGKQVVAGTAYGLTGHSSIPTSVLIASALGEYRLDDSAGSTPGLPSGVWRPVDGEGPTIIAAHPRPPIPSGMDQWSTGLQWIADQCDGPDVILAGDLNATVDHLWGFRKGDALVGDCHDAGLEAGAAAIGTWPTAVPAWLGTPIDHVLFGSAWTVGGVRVITSLDHDSSDHRAVVAVLDRANP